MTPAKQRLLWRAFEDGDKKKIATVLLELARTGVRHPMLSFSDHPLYDDFIDFCSSAIADFLKGRGGLIYVVHNPAMPGFYKIGLTRSATIDKRLKSLNSAGVVGKIYEVDCALAIDRFGAEAAAHKEMGRHAQQHKEYFACADYRLVSAVMKKAVDSDNSTLMKAFPCIQDCRCPDGEQPKPSDTQAG